jgi:probable HAF family extracellular repeat protein
MSRSTNLFSARRLTAGLLSAPLLAALVIAGSGTVSASASSGYTVTDLGTLPGASQTAALGINGWNQVVGVAAVFRQQLWWSTAVLWDGDTITNLGTLPGGNWSEATGINDSGQIVGMGDNARGANRALLWDGSVQDLGTLGGDESEAYAIDNNGDVVGSAWLSGNSGPHAFMWTNGTMRDLGNLGGNISRAHAINDAGTIVGSSLLPDMKTIHAVMWQSGVIQDLGSLAGYPFSEARGINSAGQIVGQAWTAPGPRGHPGPSRAVVWDGGTIRDLGTLGGQRSMAAAIDDAGQVVGQAQGADGTLRGFVWDNGTMYDVNSLIPLDSGWTLSPPTTITYDGLIVGGGVVSGAQDGYLLTPNDPPLLAVPSVTNRAALSSKLTSRSITRKPAPTVRVSGLARQQPAKHGVH